MSDRVYRPGMKAVLRVTPFAKNAVEAQENRNQDPIDMELRVVRATLEINNHLTADTLKLTVEWKDANVDPRFLKAATVQFWMGDIGEAETFKANDSNYRFIGICVKARRQSGDGGHSVELDFHDYTSMFLHAKPMPTRGVPSYNDKLSQAWQLICDNTGFPDFDDPTKTISSVAIFRNELLMKGGVQDYTLKGNVPDRLRALTVVPSKEGSSAWDVWQNTVASLGLISYIERDICVVTSTTELWSEDDAPVLTLGSNILEADEIVDATVSDKGVALTAIDTTTGKVIEAFFPPPGDPRVKVKRSTARRKDYKPDDLQSEKYEYFEYHDVLNEDQLFEIAKRAYAEKSRQEIQGSVKTAEMFVVTKRGKAFDLLDLRAGQLIHIEVDPDLNGLLKNEGSHEARVDYLVERGYTRDVATIISRNLESYPFLNCAFHTKSVVATLSEENFEIQIHYQNRIIPTGSTGQVAADEGIGNAANNHAPGLIEFQDDNDNWSKTKNADGSIEFQDERDNWKKIPREKNIDGRTWPTPQGGKNNYYPPLPGEDPNVPGRRGSGGGGSSAGY